MALLNEGYSAWQKIPVNNSGVNINPVLDTLRNKHKQDITELVIEQSMKGLYEEGLMEFSQMDENNMIAIITPTGRAYIVNQQDKSRNRFLAILGAVLGSLGFVLSLTKIIWDIVK